MSQGSEWKIFTVKDTRAHFVGTVEAPNEEAAINCAMEVFKIGERQSVLALRQPKAQ
jgi:1,2-phenylacetyl-CoA epoxidase PaaB subunit